MGIILIECCCRAICQGLCNALFKDCCNNCKCCHCCDCCDNCSCCSCSCCSCISCLKCHVLFFDFINVGFAMLLHVVTYFQYSNHSLIKNAIITVISFGLVILKLGIFIYDIKTKVKRNTSRSTFWNFLGLYILFVFGSTIVFAGWKTQGIEGIGLVCVGSLSFLSFMFDAIMYDTYNNQKKDLENKKNNEQQNNDDINDNSNNQNYVSITTIDNEQNANEPAPHI